MLASAKSENTAARLLVVTTGLGTGGAEKVLARLLPRLRGRAIDPAVISLQGRGAVSAELEASGIPVLHMNADAPWRLPAGALRAVAMLRRFRPDVIQGWMYHGNLAATLLRGICPGRPKLIWGIRQSLYDIDREKPLTRGVIRVGAAWSRTADAIIYNSETSRRQHRDFGYADASARVIDNGFDTERFAPDPAARRRLRDKLGVAPDTPLIGLVARFHPVKGHEVFLGAAARLAERMPSVHFVLAGTGVSPRNPALQALCGSTLLQRRLHFLGEVADAPGLLPALDIVSLTSRAEAFPNILGEAMSCGIPCVASDVGDIRRLLGDAGLVVPPCDDEALAATWLRLLSMPQDERRELGAAARTRIKASFSLDRMTDAFRQLLLAPSADRRGGG